MTFINLVISTTNILSCERNILCGVYRKREVQITMFKADARVGTPCPSPSVVSRNLGIVACTYDIEKENSTLQEGSMTSNTISPYLVQT